jgi:hypothetical protein
VKRSYTDLINIYVKDDKQKLRVFDRNGVYCLRKRLVRTTPKRSRYARIISTVPCGIRLWIER